MLGLFVALYLFLGGVGAGVMLTTAVWSLLFHRTSSRSFAQSRAFDTLACVLYGTSFVVLVLACLCLLLDLGRPERFILLLIRPTVSLISVGSFLLLAALLVALALVAVRLPRAPRVGGRLRGALDGAGAMVALGLMVYTGLYMAWMEAVPLWNNAALPVLLALSSASSGVALVLVVAPFCRAWPTVAGWSRLLRRIHRVVLVLEAIALGAFIALAVGNPFAHPSLATLLGPTTLGPWFVVGFAGLGLVVPLAAEAASALARTEASALPAAEVLCVIGGLILRFCLVLAGSHWLG